MKARAKEIGAGLNIYSEKAKGTTIEIILDTHKLK
jgi:signal transduction histidine kinase